MLGGLSGIPYLYYTIKNQSMKATNTKVNTVKENVEFLKSLSGDEFFFRGQHPDTRTDMEWVNYMNKKHPHLKWTGKDDKK
jgi:hypothetical protein